nr:ABC transporter permease [Desulfitobacterium hafniense]
MGVKPNVLLLDSRFAEAHGLSVGDRITAGEGEKQTEWLIQGIVRAGEYIYYAPEGLTVPDYQKYGFAYTNASSLPEVPFNEIILTVAEGSTLAQAEISAQIRERLAGATILSRHHQTSYRKVADAMTGIKQIGLLFSLAFFLTGALVTWITVSRMLENQRQHLGTLRSLGYSKKEITGRYALFGVLITLPSMILGWIVARCLIAEFLYRIGMTYYTIEAIGVIPFTPHFFLSALCVTAVTCGGTFFSCRRSLELTPAALMRPKPPAQGHRIFLERITPYWRRLSFSGKIVTRNLFRNKGRMLMGLVGIIGSTSLILCGFGLMNSINGMLDRAFKETVQYDVEIKLRTPSTVEQLADMYNTLSGQHVDATMAFSVYVYGKGDVKALILW